MKRVLVSAGIFGAMMAATTGMAAADAGLAPQTYTQQANVLIAQPSSGSGEAMGGDFFDVIAVLATGSAEPCDGLQTDVCNEFPAQAAQAQPIVDSGTSMNPVLDRIFYLLGWLGNGSSAPCTGLCGPF
ncbi:hypothetical protein ACTWPB_04905 [Nocardia sp. IBHARD005]|uniref:hypothetical protein n=1 Tax=Nocardia sp. IBHARD005 TaxID=3457765 RepID=UPI00405A0B8B